MLVYKLLVHFKPDAVHSRVHRGWLHFLLSAIFLDKLVPVLTMKVLQ